MSPFKTLSRSILFGSAAAIASGCAPAVLDWTPDDAPKTLQVDISHSNLPIAFGPKSASLSASEAGKLSRFATQGGVQPDDRLVIEASDSSTLSEKRRDAIAGALLRQGISGLIVPEVVPGIGHDKVVVSVERAVVTLPNCPNWSKPPTDYSAQVSSNFGCATAMNLGMMVADPNDLIRGRPTGPGNAYTNAGAVAGYIKTYGRGSPGSPSPFPSDTHDTETK